MTPDWLEILLINRHRRRQARCPHPAWRTFLASPDHRPDLVTCDRCHAIAEDTHPRQLL
jgi:hypothetical protein